MRLALLQGAPLRELFSDILVLVIFSLVLLPASLLAFRYAVRRAKADGSLSHF
jgi:ABC-2 type transport system permease protein